jgi:hypothetical protein
VAKKMKKTYSISLAAISVFLLAILASNLVMASITDLSTSQINTKASLTNDVVEIPIEIIDDVNALADLAPETYEEAEASILPVRNRFILWTGNGVNVMWGFYGNGRFAGTDNNGKRCWGIYGKGVFAGFYDGDFFYGKYEAGKWKAQYLFGLENARGEYKLFPSPTLTADSVVP